MIVQPAPGGNGYPVNMTFTLPEEALPAKLTLNPELQMTDDEYFEFCQANPDVRFERMANGEIIIVPPTGLESDDRNQEVATQLRIWAKKDGRGKMFGPTTEFFLPSGAAYSPGAGWVSYVKMASLTKEQRRKFVHLCPEFVIEVMSPTDRLKKAKEKMEDYMANGVQLGWLIDGDNQTVYIYRPGQSEPEQRTGIHSLAGEGPLAGFELDLKDIWAGL